MCSSLASLNLKNSLIINEIIKMITKDFTQIESFTDICPDITKSDVADVIEWMNYWRNQGEDKLLLTANENY